MTPPVAESLQVEHIRRTIGAIQMAMAAERLDNLIISAGRPARVFQDDQTLPYRPGAWFSWLIPIDAAPDSLILIRINGESRLTVVSPEDYWHAPVPLPTGNWVEEFELDITPNTADSHAALQHLAGATAWLGTPSAPHPAWIANPPRLLAQLEQLRCRKSAYELACMRQASHLGAKGHQAAEQGFRSGSSELDIHLAFLAATRQTEAQCPYGSIVALNEHAAVLHYQYKDATAPAEQHSLLLDAGASCHGYASDITRTWAARPGLFASLVEGMHGLQQQLCAAVRPGVDWRELHLRAHHLVAQLLHEAGVLKMEAGAAVVTGVSGTFLPHGLGHLLGLQVHDVGGFKPDAESAPIAPPPGHPWLRLTRRLEPGMVVTVEPGLYFIDSLLAPLRAGPHAASVDWRVVEQLRPCGGIRIEDNVVVTDTGNDNLTRGAGL
jgi:Xaa-Pro dipeptidase